MTSIFGLSLISSTFESTAFNLFEDILETLVTVGPLGFKSLAELILTMGLLVAAIAGLFTILVDNL